VDLLVDNDHTLFDNATRAYHYRARKGVDSHLGMYDGPYGGEMSK